jgi:hypothetical protein
MSIQLFPPPTVYEQNPAWQAVNKALNATVKYEIVTAADYPVKLRSPAPANGYQLAAGDFKGGGRPL